MWKEWAVPTERGSWYTHRKLQSSHTCYQKGHAQVGRAQHEAAPLGGKGYVGSPPCQRAEHLIPPGPHRGGAVSAQFTRKTSETRG